MPFRNLIILEELLVELYRLAKNYFGGSEDCDSSLEFNRLLCHHFKFLKLTAVIYK